MSSNEQINKDHSAGGDEPPVDPPQAVSAQINTENVDSILDEIDEVLVPTEEVIEVRRGLAAGSISSSVSQMAWTTWRLLRSALPPTLYFSPTLPALTIRQSAEA